MAQINPDISDLFFNRDLSAAEVCERGPAGAAPCITYDEAQLREEAEQFLASLDRLGIEVPRVDDLIADFHGRL